MAAVGLALGGRARSRAASRRAPLLGRRRLAERLDLLPSGGLGDLGVGSLHEMRALTRDSSSERSLALLSRSWGRRRPTPSSRPADGPGRRRARPTPDRGRHEDPLAAGRLHHGAALLQAAQQHRHARRPPVDAPAASSSPRRRSRTRPRPAGRSSRSPTPVADHGRHDLRRLLPLAAGPLRLQPRLLLDARSAAARCTAPGRRQRRLPLRRRRAASPTDTWNATNYWVDANFSATPPADTRAPARRARSRPADGATDVAGSTDADRHLRRGDGRRRRSTRTTFTLTDELGAAVAGDRRLRRADAARPRSRRRRALALGRTLHGDRRGRRGGVNDAAGNPLAADHDLVLQHARALPVHASSRRPRGRSATRSPTRRSRSA